MQEDFSITHARERACRWLALEAERHARLEHRPLVLDPGLDPEDQLDLMVRIDALTPVQRGQLRRVLLVECLPEPAWPQFNGLDLERTLVYVAAIEAGRPIVGLQPRHLELVPVDPRRADPA